MDWTSITGFIALLCLFNIRVTAQTAEPYSSCRTPDDFDGICIGVRQCPALRAVLMTRPLSVTSVDFLRLSQCNYHETDPLVCCPLKEHNIDSRSSGNPLLPEDCGSSFDISTRISEGEAAGLDEFPWMALLEYNTTTDIETNCSGFLINHRYVMTAAHCVKGLRSYWNLTSVRLGEHDTATDRDCINNGKGGTSSRTCADNTVSVGIEEKIVHERFKPTYRDRRFDVALLRLSRDVQYTNFIKPICLPSSAVLPQTAHVAGWGITETEKTSKVKLKISLSIVESNACAKTYKNAMDLGYGQICAGGQGRKDACRGDSGGPLMSILRTPNGDSRWTAVGIVSFGTTECGLDGWPGIYTNVYDFSRWAMGKLRP